MHFQKLLPVICVASLVSASALTVRAADTDAQARARELLRQKMSQLDTQNAPATPSNSAPAPAPAPAVPAPAPTPAPVAAAPAPAPAPVTPAPVAQTPAPRPVQPAAFHLTPEQLQQVLDAERSEKARLDAADRSSAATVAAEKKPEVVKTRKTKEPAPVAPAPVSVANKPVSPSPVDAPIPPALSGSKEQRLLELLERYKADKISPYEYHQERAKILAE